MSDGIKKVPFKRHFISLELKIKILDRLKNGEKVSHVAKTFNLNEATIRTIQKNEQKIRASVAAGCSIFANMTARPRAPIIEKMEKALSIWIEDCSKQQIPLDTSIIKHKALQIYNYLRENGESSTNPDFVASNGWFGRFKKRFSSQNLKMQGERPLNDTETAKTYPKELEKIVERGKYTAHQVFNASETGLGWKKMPMRTIIPKKEEVTPDIKVSKDRVTVLMCSNASGDHMVKPMVVYRSLNPRAMKNFNKNALPVYWTANKKAWVTPDLFNTWFLNCFVPSVENYLKEKSLEFKVLLILDNASRHPKNLYHPNVEIIFLPPNTAALLQPLDQGIIATFKTHYIKHSLGWVVSKIDERSIGVMEAWKLFTILDCINLISSSIKDIKSSTLNACWKNLWPDSVETGNLVEPAENRIDAIVEIAKSVGGEGFDDINPEDILELLVEEEADETNLGELTSEVDQINSEEDNKHGNPEVQNFTLKSIREGLNLAEQLEFYFLYADPSAERSAKFKTELQKCLAPYSEIYKDLLATRKESSDDEDILPDTKHPRLMTFKTEDENIM